MKLGEHGLSDGNVPKLVRLLETIIMTMAMVSMK